MGARAQEESKTKSGIASRDKESRGITRNHVCMRLKKGARNRFIEVKDRFCLLSFIERQTPSFFRKKNIGIKRNLVWHGLACK